MAISGETPFRIALPTQFEMGTVNCYLYKTPVPTLIDCGEKSDASWDALIQGLSERGLLITDIERIIITHAHVDHMGMAAKVAVASGAKVYVSELVKDWAINLADMQSIRWQIITGLLTEITSQENSPLHQGFGKFFNNYVDFWDPIPEECISVFSLDDTLSMGGQEWDVMHAPGHCINQTCFYNKTTQELIASDMLLRIAPTPVIDASIEDPSARASGLSEMVKTMERFKNLDISVAYPGHYDPITEPKNTLQAQLDRIIIRTEQTLETIKEGPKNFFEIMDKMYKGRISGPAIPMMIGYLDVLIDSGQIQKRQTNEGLQYF